VPFYFTIKELKLVILKLSNVGMHKILNRIIAIININPMHELSQGMPSVQSLQLELQGILGRTCFFFSH